MRKRIVILMLVFSVTATALYLNLYGISSGRKYAEAGSPRGSMTLSAGNIHGSIYDCSMRPLNGGAQVYRAVVRPSAAAWEALTGHVLYPENWRELFGTDRAFVCETDTPKLSCPDITMFTLGSRDSSSELAMHIVGYTGADGHGICGLEAAYDDFLRANPAKNSVTFSVDASGGVLAGISKDITRTKSNPFGVVTTIDTDIQQICENALRASGFSGAAVVLEVKSSDIRAAASNPSYSLDTLADALDDENSPLLNRAFLPYSVGSIFKLVVAAAALESNVTDFEYTCTGSIDADGQLFRCHHAQGHGTQDMETAMVNSCNPYFIALGQRLESEALISMAKAFGFGREFPLAQGIQSAAGRLQTANELLLPAEKANMCFGQGLLTATPLQIAHLTCVIASEGICPVPRLVIGTTADKHSVRVENPSDEIYVISRETAYALHKMMAATVEYNESSPAKPSNTTAAGKTSTAQTGRYDDNGKEYCHSWITGYFPLVEPRYCVTVFCEDGGYGNRAAAPVFKQIIEEITEIRNIPAE